MPPLPDCHRGERRQPRFTASRQPFTTVVRPCAARCCKTMPSRCAAASSRHLGVDPHAVLKATNGAVREGVRFESPVVAQAGVGGARKPAASYIADGLGSHRNRQSGSRVETEIGYAARLPPQCTLLHRGREGQVRALASYRSRWGIGDLDVAPPARGAGMRRQATATEEGECWEQHSS